MKGLTLLKATEYAAPIMAKRMQEMVTDLRRDLNNNAAHAALNLDQWDNAAGHASDVLEVEPLNIKAMYRLGLAQDGKGDWPAAIVQMKKVLEVEKSNKAAQKKLNELETRTLASDAETLD